MNENFVPILNNKIVSEYINNRILTLKNANKNIVITKGSHVSILITNMIISGNPKKYRSIFSESRVGLCSINMIHKDILAQQLYYHILINNEIKTYCNYCFDFIIRFSIKMIYKLSNIQYKKLRKLRKIYLLIRKSYIYDELDIDCFNKIIDYLL